MRPDPAILRLAQEGRLYPSVILHGAGQDERMEVAMSVARTLLCENRPQTPEDCKCRHCSRLAWPRQPERFHPDLHVLERDLRTATSAEATRSLLRNAQLSPFEARGQVFIVAEAETLSGEAANTLLKILEEPPESAPRNFLLLCPSPDVLLPTLRSRSMSVYLGSQAMPESDAVADLSESVKKTIDAWVESGSDAWLLGLPTVLLSVSKWDEPRAVDSWVLVSSALVAATRDADWPRAVSRGVLELADDLLHAAPAMRRRSIPAQRILEGLVARHLAAVADRYPERIGAVG